MLETNGGGCYSDISDKCGGQDSYLVNPDGTVNKNLYNLNYAANKGQAWMETLDCSLDARHTATRGHRPAVQVFRG